MMTCVDGHPRSCAMRPIRAREPAKLCWGSNQDKTETQTHPVFLNAVNLERFDLFKSV